MSRDPSLITKSFHNPDSSGCNDSFGTSILNNNNSFNTNNNITVTDDRSKILTWLSPLDPNLRHYDVQMRRVDNVGDWLLRTEEFRRWHRGGGEGESQEAIIFCSGNPGVGKTYISSLVIDTLCDEYGEAGDENTAVACFYFDFAAQKEQSAVGVLGALLKQVVAGFKKIPEEIMDAFEKQKRVIGGRRLRLPEVVKLLGSLSSSRPTFFCLDAMDECAAADRANILLSLRDIIKVSRAVRVFITGRPHIGGEVERHLPGGVATVSIIPRKGDIVRYIHTKLVEDATSDEMDEKLEAEIVEKIPETVSEIFLLVSLNLDAILQETTIHRRRKRLRVMTDGLGLEDAYGATLGRIKAQGGQKSRLGMAALMWICHSGRLLGAQELCHALAVEIGSTEYDADNVSSIATVLSCCQGLVVVDKEGSTVRLIHYTLQEYLTTHSDLFQSPHSTIAETCLTYLNSRQIMALSGSDFWSTRHTPFLEYSAVYWGTHMKKEPSDLGKRLALKLFSHYEGHVSIELLMGHTLGRYYFISGFGRSRFTGLHCASMFGLVEVVRGLTEMSGVEINGMDGTGATALLWAAKNGHWEVVELLLAREDLNTDIPDNGGRTPVSWAAENGHLGVVGLLLGRRDVDPNRSDTDGRSSLSWAAGNGHEEVVKLLLGREDINPDGPDYNGPTPIWWAAGNGHEAVVKVLLGRKDVNPNRPDRYGRTPISRAAGSGHEEVVKLLLGREDTNPDKPDYNGQAPISRAAENGHKEVVKLLLGREEVKPDRLDMWHRASIWRAAGNGHEAVVKVLLGRKDVNPNTPDRNGRTPISRAAENGHEEVVKLLLGREDVSPDRPDHDGLSPILWAANSGHEAVVKLLRVRERSQPR